MKKTGIAILCLGLATLAFGQTNNPYISDYNLGEGQIIFSEVHYATNYYLEQSPSLLRASWNRCGEPYNRIAPSGNGIITSSVPSAATDTVMFYRVVADAISFAVPADMVLIPAGNFEMGDNLSDDDYYTTYATPVHTVSIDSFYIGKYEVSKEQWDEGYNWATNHGYSFSNFGSGKATSHPVQSVNWHDCVKWCNAKSEMESRTPCYTVDGKVYRSGESSAVCKWDANGYRLPSEAEWERAARGGVDGKRFPWGEDYITHGYANYYSSSDFSYDLSSTSGYRPSSHSGEMPYTGPVGIVEANAYGLYDMSGNVYEWCWDWFDNTYYSVSPSENPHGPASSQSSRILRGGSWYSYAESCRSASREWATPASSYSDVGFRICLSINE